MAFQALADLQLKSAIHLDNFTPTLILRVQEVEEEEQHHTIAKELETSPDDDASRPPHDVDMAADYEEQHQEIHEEGDSDHGEGEEALIESEEGKNFEDEEQSDSDSGSDLEGDGTYFCEFLWSILKRKIFINSLFLF